jgi:hypothetical protein
MDFPCWWDLYPERLEVELEALRQAGILLDDPELIPERGVVRLDVFPDLNGEKLHLRTWFPAFYPYTRFEVQYLDGELPRHMNPFGKNLCLIGRGTDQWEVTDTLAQFLTERLPLVFEAATAEDEERVAELEEHQGEPFTAYYPYADGSLILIDSDWAIPATVKQGELVVGWAVLPRGDGPLRGVVLQVLDDHGGKLHAADPRIGGLVGTQSRCPWVRLEAPPQTADPKAIRRLAADHLDRGLNSPVIALIFPEEVGWRDHRDGWLFVAHRKAVRESKRTRPEASVDLVRAGRAGPSDLAVRSPEFNVLSEKALAIFGLGAVGSPSAVGFARTGMRELRLVDDDIVESGTVVRWELGLEAAGFSKAPVLASHIARNWPYTSVKPLVWRVGSPLHENINELDAMSQALNGVDLVYDATAEPGIQYLLASVAAEHQLPYVAASATAGGWGGLILRIHPELTQGCWICHRLHLEAGTIPRPPADPTGYVQPPGCAESTFVGSDVDLEQVALEGVRSTVQALVDPDPGHWWDVAIGTFRSESGTSVTPTWWTGELTRHPECPASHPGAKR